eukprot:3941276-Alexandrium_andersonii.AAC.1
MPHGQDARKRQHAPKVLRAWRRAEGPRAHLTPAATAARRGTPLHARPWASASARATAGRHEKHLGGGGRA